ncbi:hypothetical protein H1C71_026748 [Ictidomys tridecemlineatus]|nr:hypothetical protein H1C71_026748 [Ictidomys tridecemlineatus]
MLIPSEPFLHPYQKPVPAPPCFQGNLTQEFPLPTGSYKVVNVSWATPSSPSPFSPPVSHLLATLPSIPGPSHKCRKKKDKREMAGEQRKPRTYKKGTTPRLLGYRDTSYGPLSPSMEKSMLPLFK